VQVLGVSALAVQGVGGDDQPTQVDIGGDETLEQRGEHRDLVALRADLDLAQDQLLAVGRRGQQVHLIAVGIDGCAHGLAVHRDRDQRRFRRLTALLTLGEVIGGGLPGGGLRAQPGADRGIHRGRAQGEYHRDRVISALIRAPIGDNSKALQQVSAFQRSRRQVGITRITRRRVATRARVRLSDDRMNQQRSSGVVPRSP
jgi:hypothetical protein